MPKFNPKIKGKKNREARKIEKKSRKKNTKSTRILTQEGTQKILKIQRKKQRGEKLKEEEEKIIKIIEEEVPIAYEEALGKLKQDQAKTKKRFIKKQEKKKVWGFRDLWG